ncbi:preprotein translocase subunit SecA [Frankia sp. AgB1.9]|uniref:preprotein translocase subunit SecA n=1 Tax=unclassified Frankia TaxID=2632575 RepID=UPI001934404C|nr:MULTISPECIES: preprotein translocase subunit SecA [unclassified Frankia]MBL7490913.1 preprotein translocase subunit SecA [Frankia sp. AgW1.1]MBL7548353.1 preprotein translocase subunit SecA [Frankia sp. AgB1.9]MBL7619061.1 preprotein translocase subunit SecA [Frankia sp. AgB1.8]
MLLDKVLRAGEGRILRKLAAIADQVNLIEDDFTGLSDAELRGMTDEFRQRLADGEETLDSLLPEAFATVREAARRTLGQRHYDVQIMGGAGLHLGNIAEMKTGEGKTLVSTLPAYLNALAGKGVHIVTVNDYLAQRDAENMGRVHRFLGLTIGVIHPQMPPAARRQQYACDITYGTNNEFGFDYLRDNMAWSGEELVQRGHFFAVVDEVDSILVDEARTPLIISGPSDQPTRWYTEFSRISPTLKRDVDYEVEEGKRTVAITESGVEKVEDQLGIENLYESVNTPLVGYLNNALKAKELYKRDKDYIVVDGEVLIVDEFTGRVLHGRRYSEGMHQAIEAKENVEIKQENQTLATITLQNYFRLYEKLSGMTGTAMTEAAEFHQIYKLGVVPIPTNKPMIREDQPDVVYKTEVAKFDAVVDDIAERSENGQPVLVGTTSVEKSEYLSKQLTKRGVRHEVLNAKNHEREALIVAEAGRRSAVTVATNMAGRGTDIMLGGNPEFLAQGELRGRGLSPLETPEEYEAAWPEALEKAKSSVKAEHDEVLEAGGLYVLGTERHESRRIDNQLRGRAGRQGDVGESRFYLSLGDDLMRLFNASAVEGIMDRLQIPEDVPIESKIVTRAIRSAQTQVESQNFEIRKNVLKYDEVMNKQRTVIYEERRKVLEGADLHEQVRHFVDDTVTAYVEGATAEGFAEDWDLETLWTGLGQLYPVGVEAPATDDRDGLTSEMLAEDIQTDAQDAYDRREAELGEGPDGEAVMRELERRVVLAVLDKKWREHLYEMDYLQEGIGLRAMGQRDPLVEYQREGYTMFQTMMDGIKEESVRLLFNVEVQVAGREDAAAAAGPSLQAPAPLAPLNPPAEQAPAAPNGANGSRTSGRGGARRPAGPSPAAARTAPPSPPEAPAPPPVFVKGLEPHRVSGGLQYSAPSVDGGQDSVTSYDRSGGGTGGSAERGGGPARNAPCPCGSGRKYKRCHGDPARRP